VNLRRGLVRLAGAQPDLAERSGDLTKQAAMGGVLLSTALVAGVSAFFALEDTLRLPWPAAAAAAAVWAGVILNLDRMLIVSMNGLRGARLKVAAAVPRLLLAVVIGTVISTPLTLRIFQPEIDAQLTVMHAQQVAESKDVLAKAYAEIPDLQRQVDRLQAIISGQQRPEVSDDPDVKAAQAAYDTAEKRYEDAQANAQCELNGSCGTHRPGVGDAYQQAQATANAAKQKAAEAKASLDDKQRSAGARLAAAASQQVDDARKQLPDVQSRLATEQAAKQAAEQTASIADNADDGLLSRLEALENLSSGHPMAVLTHLMLFLLFLSIELLPVVIKLLSMLGPPSAYDSLLAQRADHVKKLERMELSDQRQRAEAQARAQREVAEHHLAEQTASAKQAATKLVGQQAKIADKAVDTWAVLANKRVDAELDRWIQANAGPVPPVNGHPQAPTLPGVRFHAASPGPTDTRSAAAPTTRWDDEPTVRLPRPDGWSLPAGPNPTQP